MSMSTDANTQDIQDILVENNDADVRGAGEIDILLGDVLTIQSPHNEVLHKNTFLVEFVSSSRIKLVNVKTFDATTLQISSSGVLGDGSITEIEIVSSNSQKGYARQNDLVPGTWVNIYFGGDVPSIITGEITNIEEDQIEIATTDGDTIFINFNYQGIPDNIPIDAFEIRPAPASRNDDNAAEDNAAEDNADGKSPTLEREQIRAAVQKILFSAADIQMGDIIRVGEDVVVDKSQHRFNIENQTNDLLEEMISTIPNAKRTDGVLKNINTMITRFVQLRTMSSTFDENNNVTGVLKVTAQDKPLAEYLAEFKNNLYWVMMVATNVKKIYIDGGDTVEEDYAELNGNADLIEMNTLFSKYKANAFENESNKYAQLYSKLDPYMTPFYSPNLINNLNDSGIIAEADVQTNINAIIDNLGNLYSNVVSNTELSRRKFVIQQYNLGAERLKAITLKGAKINACRVKMNASDRIAIKSVVTLPEPTVQFSHINLPGSNLLLKSNLNLHFLNYWQLLKQSASVTDTMVDSLDAEFVHDENKFIDGIRHYMMNFNSVDRAKYANGADMYRQFLRTIVPKTRSLFRMVKKYIKGRLSFVDVVHYLEPFMIYPIDISYSQHKDIGRFIVDKIREYNITYKNHSKLFGIIKRYNLEGSTIDLTKMRNASGHFIYSNVLFGLLNDAPYSNIKAMLGTSYGTIGEPSILSGAEFLKKITTDDCGRLFNTAVALSNLHLMHPGEFGKIIESESQSKSTDLSSDSNANTDAKCTDYVIAKKYYNVAELLGDNDKTIYFDKMYDTTNYDIVSEKYNRERDTLPPDDFIVFLTDVFTKKGLTPENAEYDAETLVNQIKRVRDGVYAILVTTTKDDGGADFPSEMSYYVRQNDKWVEESGVSSDNFAAAADTMCNINYGCLYNPANKEGERCQSVDSTKSGHVGSAIKQIFAQFDKNYNVSKGELQASIEAQLKRYEVVFDKLKEISRRDYYKYTQKNYDMGLDIPDNARVNAVSPHKHALNLIVGQADFVKRQSDIVRFVELYCRAGDPRVPNVHDGEMETVEWLYCKESGTRLVPAFRSRLAHSFFSGTYKETLNDIIRTNGELGDDGGAWVDKFSGEEIGCIDFDSSSDFGGSRVLVQPDIDISPIVVEGKRKKLSPQGQTISNIISAMSSNMGIDLESIRDTIIKVVTERMLDPNVLKTEEDYAHWRNENAKNNKVVPEYSALHSQMLLYLTLGMYLIAIQTSVPPIKTRKTFPGCVRSFGGFPLEGEGDLTGLTYVACVSLTNKNSKVAPWSALSSKKDKIVTTLKFFIVKFLWDYPEVKQLVQRKVEHLLTNPAADVPSEHAISNWVQFLPPLRPFHVKSLDNVSEGFRKGFHTDIMRGNFVQTEKIRVIESKIISFSLAIQELIQDIVAKKDLLLKTGGTPYMDNACCNDGATTTTFGYFANENTSIRAYNAIVEDLSTLLYDVNLLVRPSMLLSQVNTKQIFPQLTTEFSTETIYLAFIQYCRFHSMTGLDAEFEAVCATKPGYLRKSDTIYEKIEKLKRDGRTYSKEQFLRLLQLVNRKNIIQIQFSGTTPCTQPLRSILDKCDEDASSIVPSVLVDKLRHIIDIDDVAAQTESQTMRDLKNYLAKANASLVQEILTFIQTKSKLKRQTVHKITVFLTTLGKWVYQEQYNDKYNDKDKDSEQGDSENSRSAYTYICYLKMITEMVSKVFPSAIVNGISHTITVPEYWKLGPIHENKIEEMVKSFYAPLKQFHADKTIVPLLYEAIARTAHLDSLSRATPSQTNIAVGDTQLATPFNNRVSILLHEHYFLVAMKEYINLTTVRELIVRPSSNDEDQDQDDDDVQDMYGNSTMLKFNAQIARLLGSYLDILMKCKKGRDISYKSVKDKMFKAKEAEKYTFTDRLKEMSEEDRATDTVLKNMKLGPLYSLGNNIRDYNQDTYAHDKTVAEKVAEIQNRRQSIVDGDDMDDELQELQDEADRNAFIEHDELMMNDSDGYDDGNPWGDEED